MGEALSNRVRRGADGGAAGRYLESSFALARGDRGELLYRSVGMAEAASSQGVITLQCRLVGELRRFLPDGERGEGPVEVAAASTVGALLEQLELPERDSLVVGLNGTKAEHDAVLSDGDEVTIVAAMTGGVG